MSAVATTLPLVVKNLGYTVEGRVLLHDISFEVATPGVTVLLGPNGAGKSLLLRLCHGLLTPGAGAVQWAGNGTGHGVAQRHAMVFQKPVMLRRSALANILHAVSTGPFGREARWRAQAALDRFGLTHLGDQPARLLSGGEQQRLALARAWALAPECLFLDEPCSQLDPAATRQIEHMIATLVAEGMTIVMSTHDLGQARRLGQRVLFLHRGRLIEDRAADDFFSNPETEAARAFVAGSLFW